MQHLGAFPYLLTHQATHAQVFATVPVLKMGVAVMQDLYQSLRAATDPDSLGAVEIEQAFSQIRQLKYQQFVRLKGAHSCSTDVRISGVQMPWTLSAAVVCDWDQGQAGTQSDSISNAWECVGIGQLCTLCACVHACKHVCAFMLMLIAIASAC